jgi:hypothetical protein
MEKRIIAVILPAGKVFDRTFEALRPTAMDIGASECVRISTDLSQRHLTSTFDQLAQASVIIADLTARNPNVMFLVGYALGLKKQVTYITQHIEDFPLDHATQPIVYGSDFTYLTDQIISQVSGCDSVSAGSSNQDARNKFLSIFGDLLQKHGYEHRGSIVQDEPKVYTLVDQNMDLALVQDIARRGRELGIRVRLM